MSNVKIDQMASKVGAKKFDFMEIFSESYKLAKERNEVRNTEELEESISENLDVEPNSIMKLTENCEHDDNEHELVDGTVNTSSRDNEATFDNPYFLPVSNNLILAHGCKPLTALGVDPAGARVATGGFDFDVKLWDFGGMDNTCRPFKVLRPCEEHQIKHVDFSQSGEHFLVVSGSAQAHIFDRDGNAICYTNKGYQYITDPANAKGHTHALNWATWHPLDSNKLLTCAQDATLRIWDLNDAEEIVTDIRLPSHRIVIKPKNSQGRKCIPTACAYTRDGHLIAAGCQDGSIQVWDTRKPLVNTVQLKRGAHPMNSDITSVAWSWDSKQLLSRSMDDTLKLWDLRALSKEPVHMFTNLPVLSNQTEASFSPNDHVIATAVGAPRGEPNKGCMAFYRRDNFQLIKKVYPDRGNVIALTWHHRLNQIFCTSSGGVASLYYDPDVSHNGAIMCINRQPSASSRRRHLGSGDAYMKPVLLTYNEESISDVRKAKKHLNYTEDEAVLAAAAVNAIYQRDHHTAHAQHEDSARKRVPTREDSVGNRLGSLHQFMVQQIVLQKTEADERAEKDIRGAILRHADEASKKPFWTKAYQKTQPNAVFYDPDAEVKKDDIPVWKKQKLA